MGKESIPFFNTYIDPTAYESVKVALDSTFLSEGKLVEEFEKKLAEELGLLRPVAVNSGTSALHLPLVLAGINPGDEVICPAQTFVATATVIAQERAIPVFADIQYGTGNIDPRAIEEKITDRTKAIIAVHWAGYPCDIDEILSIGQKRGIPVIEDAAHALGATYKNRIIGSISDFTSFSFQAIKHVTTGDGGALCVRDERLYDSARARRWFGIDRKKSKPSPLGERSYDIDEVGYKYHLNDYAAALGIANLRTFKERLGKRRKIAKLYRDALQNIPGIALFSAAADRESAHWLFGLHVEKREDFIAMMRDAGIATSVVHQGIDHNSLFGGKRHDLPNQRKFDDTQIHIPLHDGIDEEKAGYIVQTIKKGW